MAKYLKFDNMKLKIRGNAWAVLMPRGTGKYYPEGIFKGWEEKVTKCSANSEKEHSYYNVLNKVSKNLGPLEDCEIPEVFCLKRSYEELASMLLLGGVLIAVEEKLKSLIEHHDRNLHQFFPLRIEYPNGETYPKSYYGLIILQSRDSFLPAISGENIIEEKTPFGLTYYDVYDTKKCVSKLTLAKERIGNVHLWRECRLITSSVNIFMSDQLASAIDNAGFEIFRHYPVRLI